MHRVIQFILPNGLLNQLLLLLSLLIPDSGINIGVQWVSAGAFHLWVLGYVYTVRDPYRCIPDLVADRRSVYTQNASIVAFFSRDGASM